MGSVTNNNGRNDVQNRAKPDSGKIPYSTRVLILKPGKNPAADK